MPVLYHNTLSGFIEDVESGMIATAIEASGYDMEVGNAPSPGERAAWDKSLGAVKDALKTLPGDLRVYAEYVIPPNSLQRVDFMITGLDAKGKKTAVILELKQWSDGSISLLQDQSEYTVHALWDNEDKDHPSHQAHRYAILLRDHCSAVWKGDISVKTCVFLHNYDRSSGIVNDPRFNTAINHSPIFYKGEGSLLAEFISSLIASSDSGDTVGVLEDPRNHVLDPRMVDVITATINGGKSFPLTPEQWTVFSDVKQSYDAEKKTVVIITGAPGTGKTILALKLLGEFRRNKQLSVRYVTHSQNLQYIFINKLCSDRKKLDLQEGIQVSPERELEIREWARDMISSDYFRRNARIKDVSIVDEAHRLQRMADDQFNPSHYGDRAEYVIENSTLSVFLIDDDQQVRWDDYCTSQIIMDHANKKNYQLIPLHLKDGIRQYTPYINWATDIFSPSPKTLKMNPRKFLVKVFDSAPDMYAEITRLNGEGHRSRMLAGYCWTWKSRNVTNKETVRPEDRDILLHDRSGNVNLSLLWNQRLKKDDYSGTWIDRDDSVDEVGCIHTAQGVDMEYVGVIIGKDVTFNKETGRVEFNVNEHPKDDLAVTTDMRTNTKVDQQNAERLIRNAYRVLLTRSTKGCFIYCEDAALSEYIKAHLR